MTKKECMALIREEILPVILGNGLPALRLALRLRILYGLSPLVCAHRRGLAGWLMPTAYLPLIRGNPRLLREQLSDLAERYEDCLLLLIPSTEGQKNGLLEEREILESEYLLTSPEELSALLAPLLQ